MSNALAAALIGLATMIAGAVIQSGTGLLCSLQLFTTCADPAEFTKLIEDLRQQRDREREERDHWQGRYVALFEQAQGLANEVERESDRIGTIFDPLSTPCASPPVGWNGDVTTALVGEPDSVPFGNARLESFAASIRRFELPDGAMLPPQVTD
ncbi:MAG: hypothetical protein AAFU59_02930 [Pseudomonadota bacterium]